jgi:hypothetical protein
VSWCNYRRYFLLGVRLVWPILLRISVVCHHASSIWRWARPGPTASNCSDEKPCGSHIDKPLSVSWLNSKASILPQVLLIEASLVWVLSKRNLEVVFPKKILEWCVLFQRKRALTECSPRVSCYLEQKVGGSWIFRVEKTKNPWWPCEEWNLCSAPQV